MPNLARRLYWSAFLVAHAIGQRGYPWASPQRVACDRDRNLRRMVAHAYRWVPYYREAFQRLGLTPDDVQTLDDLRRLPLISVEDVQRDPEAFRSQHSRADELTQLLSGGSTGSPHAIWHDLRSVYHNIADAERENHLLQRQIGCGPRYRTLNLGALDGHVYLITRASRQGALWPHWLNRRRTRVNPAEGLEALAERLERIRPHLVGGYGSELANLFLYLHRRGAPFHAPRLVRYTSDALPEEVRRLLEGQYGVQVFSAYQCIEALRLGWECEAHQGYHINADHYPVRLVDAEGRDVAPGEVGEVVVSNLVNRGTVLLNYRLGDLAQRIDAPCPCGRGLPRIGYVQGRTVDALTALDGRRVRYTVLDRAIRQHGKVCQYQAVQEASDRLVVKVRDMEGCDRDGLTQALVQAAQATLGAGMRVQVLFTEDLARTPAGKHRYVINRVQPSPQ